MARAYLKYLLSLLIFGTNGIVANHISLSSRQIVFMRTLIGGLFLGLVFFLSKGRLRALSDRRCLLFLLGSGVCMGTSWMCLFEAYRLVGVSVAGGVILYILMAILAPIAATLIQMAISRSREYLADAGGAQYCNDPLALAGALDKLQRAAGQVPMQNGNPTTAEMFIVSPLFSGGMANLFSTHPPMEERIARLQQMAGQMPQPAASSSAPTSSNQFGSHHFGDR